jgi:hypothetical protein
VFLEFLVAEGERRKIKAGNPPEWVEEPGKKVCLKCPKKERRSVLTVFIKTFAC